MGSNLEQEVCECLAAKSLAATLKDMCSGSFVTKDTANELYANGLQVRLIPIIPPDNPQAIEKCMNTSIHRLNFESRGRLLAFRCHRNTWTLWIGVPNLRCTSSNMARKRTADGSFVRLPEIRTPSPIRLIALDVGSVEKS